MDLFYSASVPEPVTILGLRLRPFSLGHLILLHRVESAFVLDSEITIEDLALSVFICSQTYKGAVETFSDPDLPKFMLRWHERITGADSWLCRLGLRKPNGFDFWKKCDEFAGYLKAGCQRRQFHFKDEDCREVFCPQAQLVKVTLMSEMGFREEDLLDRSWALCLDDYIVHKAIKGVVQLNNPEAIADALAFANKLAENLKAKGVKVNGAP